MGIISTFKALSTVNKITAFIKEHEAAVQKIKELTVKVQEAVVYLQNKKDVIQTYIDKAKDAIEQLKRLLDK